MNTTATPTRVADGQDADAWAVQYLRTHALAVLTSADPAAPVWRDTRPMLDPRERSDIAIDVAELALEHAASRGLIAYHPADRFLIRLTTTA